MIGHSIMIDYYAGYGAYPPMTSVPPPGYDMYAHAAAYPELDDGPPGDASVEAGSSGGAEKQGTSTGDGPPGESVTGKPTTDTDEMDDLRMLGIDVDDIAAAALR